MRAYAFDINGHLVGAVGCQIDPLESARAGKDIFLTPAQATLAEPPKVVPPGMVPRWTGAAWALELKPIDLKVPGLLEIGLAAEIEEPPLVESKKKTAKKVLPKTEAK